MRLGWVVVDLRPTYGVHVVPEMANGKPSTAHMPTLLCQCRPRLIRNGPLDEPVISHREPSHPGAVVEGLDA